MPAQEVWDKSLVPKRFRSIRWKSLDGVSKQVKDLAHEYCNQFPVFAPTDPNGLYLFSPTPGNGKTAVAVAILRELIERKKIVRMATFMTMPDVIELIHQARRQDVGLYEHPIGVRLFTSELVVLDDVGKGRLTDWAVNQYFILFNRLYSDNKAIVCTSNYSPSKLIGCLNSAKESLQFDPNFGHSIVSRISDMCEKIEFMAGDYRIGQA